MSQKKALLERPDLPSQTRVDLTWQANSDNVGSGKACLIKGTAMPINFQSVFSFTSDKHFLCFKYFCATAMAALLFSLCIVSSMMAFPNSTRAAIDREAKPVGDYRRDLKTFVKRSKNESDSQQKYGAVVDLCLLHQQLVRDSRFTANKQLKGFRAVAASRLKKCRREIEVAIKRAERTSKSLDSSKDRNANEIIESAANADMQVLSSISGGPIRLWEHTGFHFGPNGICDYGPDLVRLIETTIDADSWQSNGGTGIIHYYRPLRILVVSASSHVHQDLSDLLETLRYNGR